VRTTSVILNNVCRVVQIIYWQGFTKLILTEAGIIDSQKLTDPTIKFTAFSNSIPGSNKYNCFDILAATYKTIKNPDVTFTELQICCNTDIDQSEFEIQLQIEYD
jgi:hypothetical protein